MKKLILVIKGFAKRLGDDNIGAYASSCAYFFFMSFVPIIILLLSILPYTPIDFDWVLNFVDKELPGSTGDFVTNIILEIKDKSVGTMSLAAIATLWSAGKGVNALINGFNAIDKTKDKRNAFLLRVVSCLYTLVFLASIIVLILLMVFGKVVSEFIMTNFPNTEALMKNLDDFKGLLSFALMVVIFMICYALLPYKRYKIREQLPGAVFSAISWTGFSYIFSLYINNFNAFSMYGSLTTIIIFLFWLYVCMYILLIGANLNRYFRPVILVLEPKNLNEIKSKNQKENAEED